MTGFTVALKTILSGDVINAEDALEIKLVDFVVAKSRLFDFSFRLVQKMTKDRPLQVIHAVMQALQNARTLPKEEAMREETRLFCELALEEAKRRNGN